MKIKKSRYTELCEAEDRVADLEETMERLQDDLLRAKHFLEAERESKATRCIQEGQVVLTRETLNQFQVPMHDLYRMHDELKVAKEEAEKATTQLAYVMESIQHLEKLKRELEEANAKLGRAAKDAELEVTLARNRNADLCQINLNYKAQVQSLTAQLAGAKEMIAIYEEQKRAAEASAEPEIQEETEEAVEVEAPELEENPAPTGIGRALDAFGYPESDRGNRSLFRESDPQTD